MQQFAGVSVINHGLAKVPAAIAVRVDKSDERVNVSIVRATRVGIVNYGITSNPVIGTVRVYVFQFRIGAKH